MAERELTGIEKVAGFLLSLEEERASAILKHIGPEVVTEIAEAMTKIDPGTATPKRIADLKRLLAIEASGPRPIRPRQDTELGALLTDGIGRDRSREVVDRVRERRYHERPFLEIEEAAPEGLARALGDESPAVCALVLSHIDPAVSAAVLSVLEPETALGIVKRMASLTPPGIDMLRSIAEGVKAKLDKLAQSPVAVDPDKRLKTIANMLNFSSPEIEQAVLQGIEKEDETTAQEIRERMFAWEDLASIDKRSMQKILGSIDTRTLSIALKACQPEVEENVLSNLSARVRGMVDEERELAGAMALSEVLAAREQLMTTVRGLIESGEFSPARSGEELVT